MTAWHRNNWEPADLAAVLTEAAQEIETKTLPSELSSGAVRFQIDGEWVDVTDVQLAAFRDPGSIAWVLTLSAKRRLREGDL